MSRESKALKTTVAGRQAYFADMLTSHDKWLSKSENFLTMLARKVMFDLNLHARQYYTMIERWLVSRIDPSTTENQAKIAMERNNFYTEVTRHGMTVNNFSRFTQSLGASKVTLTIKLEFSDGRQPHSSQISFNNILGDIEDVDETDEEA